MKYRWIIGLLASVACAGGCDDDPRQADTDGASDAGSDAHADRPTRPDAGSSDALGAEDVAAATDLASDVNPDAAPQEPPEPDAAGDGPVAEVPAATLAVANFFQTEVVHRIEITTDPANWQAFMKDHGSFGLRPAPRWFNADFHIDGTPLQNVAFHTFGWGSRDYNDRKPNLSLDINRNLRGQSLNGITRMRIKNNGQDASALRQVIFYESMRKAGLMAPRSSFAEIFVNGQPYGFYLVEEAFTKDFVRERTGNDNGPAYEAGGCQGFVMPAEGGCKNLLRGFYYREFNPTVGNGEDLAALCTAINGPPEQFMTAVSPFIIVSEWIEQLAISTALAGDHDGFSVSGSNFRLYHDTALDKLRLVILGPDDTFVVERLPTPDFVRPQPKSSCAREYPEYRDIFLEKLVATPQGLAMYQQAVRKLRTGVMAAGAFKQRVDALFGIVSSYLKKDTLKTTFTSPERSRDEIKEYVDLRWPALEQAGF